MQVSTLALTLAAVLALAEPANARSVPSVTSVLARQAAASSGDAAQVHASLEHLGEAIVDGYVAGARDSKTPVDRQALDEALQTSVSENEPAFVGAAVDAYSEVYTPDELRQIVAYYRSAPGARGELPEALSAKWSDLRRSKALKSARLGPRFVEDIFGHYCGRATCSDYTKNLIAGLSKRTATP